MTFALYAYALGRISAVDAKNFSCGCSIKADRKKKSRPMVGRCSGGLKTHRLPKRQIALRNPGEKSENFLFLHFFGNPEFFDKISTSKRRELNLSKPEFLDKIYEKMIKLLRAKRAPLRHP